MGVFLLALPLGAVLCSAHFLHRRGVDYLQFHPARSMLRGVGLRVGNVLGVALSAVVALLWGLALIALPLSPFLIVWRLSHS